MALDRMATVAEIDAVADQLRALAASYGLFNLRHWDDHPGCLVVASLEAPAQLDAFGQAAFDQLGIDVVCLADDTEEVVGVMQRDQGRPIGPPAIYSEDGVPLRPTHLRGTYAPESGDDDELNLDA